MSSHREAPGTAQDPVADNTDLYAFVSPDKPNTVTLIANFIPTEYPPGGPNFYELGDHGPGIRSSSTTAARQRRSPQVPSSVSRPR